jgi:acetyltransferase
LTLTDRENKNIVVKDIRERYTTERTIKNGIRVIFRPIESTDKAGYYEFFKSLSQESVHMRFFEIMKDLSEEALENCCTLDYNQEIAIVALSQIERKIIGVARLIFDHSHNRGEFALIVADTWQGLGLGAELLKYTIQIAKDHKFKEIYYFVTSDNYKMIQLSNKMGFKVRSEDEDTLEMSLQLS